MILAIALSLFFGSLAGFSLLVCWRSAAEGIAQWRMITAELAFIGHAARPAIVPLRPRRAAFAQAALRMRREHALRAHNA